MKYTKDNPCREIGKLGDGNPDPCYDCANLPEHEDLCADCMDYSKYKNPAITGEHIRYEKEICYECGKSVAMGSGKFVNRISSLDSIKEREDMGVSYPEGGWLCEECDLKADEL